jgi:hypothetical protein
MIHLESLKMKYKMVLNEYIQSQTNYSQYLSENLPGNYILNSNFHDPQISKNTYQYINDDSITVPYWNFKNAAIMNNSTDLGYLIPYPNGDQAVSLLKTASISQTVNLASGNYRLSFSACSNQTNLSNPIDIQLNGITIYHVEPLSNSWTNYVTQITISESGSQILSFVGTWSEDSDRSSAIQDIKLTYNHLTSVKSSTFLGSQLNIKQVNDLQECIASCSSSSKCTGATYNEEQKICSLQSGKGNIVHSTNSSNYAIVSENLMHLNIIQGLNQQLVDINNQISESVQQNQGVYDEAVQNLQTNSTNLNKNYDTLVQDREKISKLIREFDKLNADDNYSALYTSTNYTIFIFLSILSMIIIIFLLMNFLSIRTNNTASTSSSSGSNNLFSS